MVCVCRFVLVCGGVFFFPSCWWLFTSIHLAQQAVASFEYVGTCFFIVILLRRQNESNADVWHR